MYLQTENKKGNGMRMIGEKGAVRVDLTTNIYDGKFIYVDDFQGRGEDLKKRDNPKIVIGCSGETFEFESLEDLVKQLNK